MYFFNGLTWCRIFFLPLIVRPPMWFPCKLGASASGFGKRHADDALADTPCSDGPPAEVLVGWRS